MRDYDKNPIIIKDYNYIFFPLYHLLAMPMLVYALFYVPKASPIACGLAAAVIYGNMRIFFRAFDKRTIVLSNNSIKFLHKDKVLEKINLDEVASINRTFFIIYHKSQLVSETVKKIQKIFFLPLAWLLWYLPIIIIKFFFHLFKRGSKYRFFDAIIVFNGDKFINILPATEYEYQEVRKYFMIKKPIFDTEQAKVFWDNYYQFQELISDKELL
ncbi:MAG: hypothetical protein LBJ88_02675 [Campylobacteraceae bacterium]|jgi:hypothetical protein|nr:hypothetical protein [Campylobacteraceae bacterium]